MYEKKRLITFIGKTLHSFTAIFTAILFVRLLLKIISNQYGHNVYGLHFDEINLNLSALLETAAFSLLLAIISTLILSDLLLVKMRFLLRSFHFFVSTLFITITFAILFNWLDTDNSVAWIGFILTFVICFAIGIGIKLLKFRFDDKKYSKLLEEYKSRHNANRHSG
jgi:hypothetical protein